MSRKVLRIKIIAYLCKEEFDQSITEKNFSRTINSMKENDSNQLVRWAVVIGDLIVANAIVLLLLNTNLVHIPQAFETHTKISLVALNMSMLASEYFFSSIIHRRRVNFPQVMGRTFKLTFFACLFFFALITFLIKGGGKIV